MRDSRAIHPRVGLLLLVVVLAGALAASAGDRAAKSRSSFGTFNPDDASVEFFQAIDDGQLDVKFIPRDSTVANVMIKNKTNKPLNVKLPEAFAALPVLAQRGLGGGGGALGGQGMQGGGQAMGGGMMGGGMGGMGGGMGGGGMGGMGGGMFNVPAEKVGKFKVPCVCLEHGKPEPRAAVPYKIVPLEKFTTDSSVRELCRLLADGKVPQRVAQAAAWNLANNMSWDVLSAKRIEHINGATEPYFSAEELRAAMLTANEAVALAEKSPSEPQKSPGERSVSEGGSSDDTLANSTAAAVAADAAPEKSAPRRRKSR